MQECHIVVEGESVIVEVSQAVTDRSLFTESDNALPRKWTHSCGVVTLLELIPIMF